MNIIWRERYKPLLEKIVNRKDQVNKILDFLENKTNWLTAPASTKYHLDRDGGLIDHSVGVTHTLLKLKNILVPEIPNESCVVIGLFHDIGKVGMAGKPYYIKLKIPTKDGKKYIINKDLAAMGIAARSLMLISKFISLSDNEAQAIAYHDGQYIPEGKIVAHRESALTLLLHYADYWTSHILERGE
ncbi:MAG: HD domain-containing protein [Actinomycetota bacterium]